MKKIKVVFLTGTRADYGKLKPLIKICDNAEDVDAFVYVVGMHLMEKYGNTVDDIVADGYRNTIIPKDYVQCDKMELELAETIRVFSDFVNKTKPDIIVVHGDRVVPLAGAIVGVLNNIHVAHIEGGEITGTADEFMRHAISKLSTIHFVANDEAKFRLQQMGESRESIYVIGSPDIEIMLTNQLKAEDVKKELNIGFDKYGILIYHPVTTSNSLFEEISQVLQAVVESGRNYIVINPNNDLGNETIRKALDGLKPQERFVRFDSIPFEKFIALLHDADFIIGNSSAGIREACVYGVPAIDIGTRQSKRYDSRAVRNVQHCDEDAERILKCINRVDDYRFVSYYYGDGKSSEKLLSVIRRMQNMSIQKTFVDSGETTDAIANYINEICF